MKGCTIIAPDGWQKTIEAPDGYFDAHFGSVVIEGDDEASIKELFKLAPYQKLRLLGVVGGNNGLPSGYTRLAYLESTGTQFIPTNFSPEDGVCEIDCEFQPLDISYNYHPFFGTVANENDLTSPLASRLEVGLGGSGGTLRFLAANSGWWISFSESPNLGYKYKVQVRNSRKPGETPELSINGAKQKMHLQGSTTQYIGYTSNFYIFATKATSNKSKYKAFYIAVKYDGELVQNFIPVLDPTGTPCMFDTVSKTPFYNAGEGSFIAGVENQNQLEAMLRKLPDRTGLEVGTLQVRLAAELQTAENEAKLDAMLAKNWEITQAA